jgi:predicted TIM-barrel fold metal-dependent hydrolase
MCETQAIQAIDAWAQPVTGRTRQDLPEVVRLLEKSGTARYLDLKLTPAEIVAAMDVAGIQQLMLSAWCRPGRWLITNDEVAAHVETFPERFAGVAAVDLANPVAAVRELDRAVRQFGFKALRVVPWLWKLPPNDRLTTRSTSSASNWTSHSARKSGTQAR